MTTIQTFLGVDVGQKTSGYAVLVNGMVQTCGFFTTESYTNFFREIDLLCARYRPDMIIVGKPNRFYNVISVHNRYIGILCLLGEKFQTPLIELNDRTARHLVLPEEQNKDKKLFHAILKKSPFYSEALIDQEDAVDAFILALAWGLLNKDAKG